METTQITNHTELLLQIEELRYLKNIQEENLKQSFKTVSGTLDLLSIFKGSNNTNPEFDIAKVGLNTALDLIIDMVLGKHRSIKGFLSSVLVEKFSTMLVNNNLGNVISGITQLIHKKKRLNNSN